MRRNIIAGNWKMNKNVKESVNLVAQLKENLKDIKDVEVIVCPPFTSLYPVYLELRDSNIYLGAQNLYYEDKGAYTGEISADMLKSCGCRYVIIGHSERRKYFSETDEIVNKKIKKALEYGLRPIICVGETKEQKDKGLRFDVLKRQIEGAFDEILQKDLDNIVIAYEPIWAIGTGDNETPENANKTIGYIRELLSQKYGYSEAENISILYGGSVKPENIKGFMQQKNIDGALVGGASLKAESFTKIAKYYLL